MATVTKSVDEMIDDAIERLPFLRRKIVQRNLARHPHKREEIADQVLLKISEDPAAIAIFGSSIAEGIASGSITAQTPFSIDIDKLEQLIQLILKYLPQILQLFMLFVSIAMFFVASLAFSSTSAAQGGSTGTYRYGSSGSAAVVSYGSSGYAKTYGSTGSAVVSYGSRGTAVAAYGSSGSAVASYASSGSAVASYGSSGSTAVAYASSGTAVRRPLRTIIQNRPVRSRVAAVASVAAATPVAMSSAYQVALASAQARAASRRKGHILSIEAGYTTGVGFSTFDPTPMTCLGVGGNYAVVRGVDGWYSTKVE